MADEQDMHARRGFLERLRGRWRNGLLFQEILDRLPVLGCVVRPYILVRSAVGVVQGVAARPGFSVRELGAADAEAIVAIQVRKQRVDTVLGNFATRRCFGVFAGDALVGHAWVAVDVVPSLQGPPLARLGPDQAYIAGLYIAPPWRGERLVDFLSVSLAQVLIAEGRGERYLLSQVFNRSTRRFQARRRMQDMEWRLYLHFLPRWLPGMDFRLYRRPGALATPVAFWCSRLR